MIDPANRRLLFRSAPPKGIQDTSKFEPEKIKPFSDEDFIEALFDKTEAA